uniref:HDC06489 n=1 Tax=Drosophila melanogaster TaxID=7227 RepID=Q6IGF0_DROME|nr:TPA_inf: HDC06489 [Drosophila melanogaster]
MTNEVGYLWSQLRKQAPPLRLCPSLARKVGWFWQELGTKLSPADVGQVDLFGITPPAQRAAGVIAELAELRAEQEGVSWPNGCPK